MFDKTLTGMLVISGLIVFVQAVWISVDVIVRKSFDWTWAPSFEILELLYCLDDLPRYRRHLP